MRAKAMSLLQNPGEDDFEELVACNRFIHDVQLEIDAALAAHGVSQKELARKLRVSPARVSQILGDNAANLTTRTIARIAYALGLRPSLTITEEISAAWGREEISPDEPQDDAVTKYAPESVSSPARSFEFTASNDTPASPKKARPAA